MSDQNDTLDRCFELASELVRERTGKDMAGRAAIAEILGITRRAPYKWKRVPTERCLELERAFAGRITAKQMRPDIFARFDSVS